jgi:hypothetical protein
LVDDSRLASLQAASCTYRIALGPRAGWKVLSLRAAVRLAGHQRKELERLCRTITRPALASERLIRFHGVLAPNATPRAAAREFSLDYTAAPESTTTVPRENRRLRSARDGVGASRRGG